jgi:hypothetical protein
MKGFGNNLLAFVFFSVGRVEIKHKNSFYFSRKVVGVT